MKHREELDEHRSAKEVVSGTADCQLSAAGFSLSVSLSFSRSIFFSISLSLPLSLSLSLSL